MQASWDGAKRSKLAKMAQRRLNRERMDRTPQQHAASMGASNATVLRLAAREMLGPAALGAPEGGVTPSLLCFDEVQASPAAPLLQNSSACLGALSPPLPSLHAPSHVLDRGGAALCALWQPGKTRRSSEP